MMKAGVAAAALAAVTGAIAVEQQLATPPAATAPSADLAADAALSGAITEWRSLRDSSTYPFESYARFLIAHPGWPGETALRRAAEGALTRGGWSPSTAVTYFRRYPPLSTAAKAAFAQALLAGGARDEANLAAAKAWRSPGLAPSDEVSILGQFPGALTPADQDARMDALLWAGQTSAAARQIGFVSPARRAVFAARLAFRTNAADAAAQGTATMAEGMRDAGWLADRARWLTNANNWSGARQLLAQPHQVAYRPADTGKWFDVLLTAAKGAAADGQWQTVYDIARQTEDAFDPGAVVSDQDYDTRDGYTDLNWLAGQAALKHLSRPADAVVLFDRYSRGSRSPTVITKGLYWAGRAAEAAGQQGAAQAYYARAAGFRDLFYGQLATERLGRPLVAPPAPALRPVSPAVRAAFYNKETVRAARLLGTSGAHEDQTAFIRQIAQDAKTDSDHVLADELSRTLGRPDLGVMVGRSALANGITDYSTLGYPTVRVPDAAQGSWVMVHAIARQESQFDRAAISHAGARGLMQLMPGTAREQSGKLGLVYNPSGLTTDTDYNVTLGASYFERIFGLYGSYPLAVAAYNAGPGNVNKWLRANGDPRAGADVVDWIESIPLSETRNYVQRVLENAVVYDLMNPTRSRSSGANRISWYLGKSRVG